MKNLMLAAAMLIGSSVSALANVIEIEMLNRNADGDAIVISVSDDGAGLSQADVSAARERFRQLGPTSGSGLGVSIVDEIVRGHGGRLDLVPLTPGLRAQMRFPRTQPGAGADGGDKNPTG